MGKLERMHISSPMGNYVCGHSIAPNSYLFKFHILIFYCIDIFISFDSGFDLNSCFVSHLYS